MIVPAYNAASVIEETLRSALAQTLREIEVLVVDDGSTDDTAAVVGRVADGDPRVRLIRQANAGVAVARNAAIAEARGAYIAPLDADDVWFPEKLEAQVARMERGGERMGMVYCWSVMIDADSRIRGSSFPCRVEGDVALRLFYVNFIGNASVPLYRRAAVEGAAGYDAGLHARGAQGCEDWDLSLRVAMLYETGVAPGHYVAYRVLPDSMSRDVATMARSYRAVVERVRTEWEGVPPALFRWSDANFASYLAAQSYAGGQFVDAMGWTARVLWRDPASALSPHSLRIVLKAGVLWIGGRLARAFRSQGARRSYTRAEIDTEWAATSFTAPWAPTWKPFDRVRIRRWERLRAAPAPTTADAGRRVHPAPPARKEAACV